MSETAIGINIDVDYNGLASFRTLKKDLRDVASLMEKKSATAAKAYQRQVASLESANGKLQTKLKSVAGSVDQLKQRLRDKTNATGQATQATQKWTGSLGGMRAAIAAVGAALVVMGIARVTQLMFKASESVRALNLAFAAAAGGAKEGAAEMAFVRAEAERLGLDLDTVAGSYKGILAASEASGRGSEFARRVFLGVAEASTAMALSNEDARGTFLAVQQIISKGKVSAEELRQQLGERFPVAVGIMAQALGVTTAELSKMMEQGEVTADALGPFADLLREKYGKDLAGAIALPSAELRRLGNDARDFSVSVGQAGLSDAFKAMAVGLRELVAEANAANLAEKLGGAAREIGVAFVEITRKVGPDVIAFLGTMATIISTTVVPSVQFLISMWQVLNGVFQTVAGFILSTLGGIVTGLGRLIELGAKAAEALGMDGVANSLKGASDAVGGLGKDVSDLGSAGLKAGTDLITGNHGAQESAEQLASTTRSAAGDLTKTGQAGTRAGAVISQGMDGAKTATEKVGTAAVEAGVKIDEALAKKNPELHAHMTNLTEILNTTSTAYKELGITSTAEMNRSAEASLAAFLKIQESGSETESSLTAIWENLTHDIKQQMGSLPPEWEATNREIEAMAKGLAPKLIDPYKQLRLKSPALLNRTAELALESFEKIRNDNEANSHQIAAAAEAAAQRYQEAYGRIPAEVKPYLKDVETAGVNSANAIQSAYESTGRTIGSSIRAGAEEAAEALSFVERRAQEVQNAAESSLLNLKIKPVFTSFEDSLVGLQQQLQDALRFRADVANGVIGSGIKGFRDHQLAESAKLIAALEERIEALKGKGDTANAALGGGGGASTSGSGGGSQPSRISSSSSVFAPGTDSPAGAALIPGQFINTTPIREQRESPGPTGFKIPGINFFPAIGEGSLALRRPNSGAGAAEAAARPNTPADFDTGSGGSGGGGRGGDGGRRPNSPAAASGGSLTIGGSGGRLPAKDDLDRLDREDVDGLLVTTRSGSGRNFIQPRTPSTQQAVAPQLDSREIAAVVAERRRAGSQRFGDRQAAPL